MFYHITNIGCVDLADIQLLRKLNKETRYLLCFIDIISKYTWVAALKDKTGITLSDAFQKIFNKAGRKPNKIWVDKGSEIYNKSLKSLLEKNNIEIYSTHN